MMLFLDEEMMGSVHLIYFHTVFLEVFKSTLQCKEKQRTVGWLIHKDLMCSVCSNCLQLVS